MQGGMSGFPKKFNNMAQWSPLQQMQAMQALQTLASLGVCNIR
jgi:hypothetical protein